MCSYLLTVIYRICLCILEVCQAEECKEKDQEHNLTDVEGPETTLDRKETVSGMVGINSARLEMPTEDDIEQPTTPSTPKPSTPKTPKTPRGERDVEAMQLDKAAADAATERHLDKRTAKLVSTEERNSGDVPWATYWYYIKAGGVWIFSFLLLALLCAQGAQIGKHPTAYYCILLHCTYWVINKYYFVYIQYTVGAQFQLAAWGDLTAVRQAQGHQLTSQENLDQLTTYAWISMLSVFFITVRAFAIANHRIGTSTQLHRDVLVRIMNAPIAFFDITPLGNYYLTTSHLT